MSAPDISRPGMETLALSLRIANEELVAEIILALRDALDKAERDRDAAERERDEAHYDACRTVTQRLAAAQAAGYARCVRDAAGVCRHQADNECSAPKDLRSGYECERRILALLPTTETKETNGA